LRILRRKVDPRAEEAAAAHAAGDASLEAVRGLGELEYLLGDYEAAELLLRRVVDDAGRKVDLRVDAEVALALVCLQTNRFAAADKLFTGLRAEIDLPLWELMKSFGDEQPYRIEWGGEPEVIAPFTQATTWELPRVEVAVNGWAVEARIDTGGSTRFG
jgi:hypothetical protein